MVGSRPASAESGEAGEGGGRQTPRTLGGRVLLLGIQTGRV